jgi:hypothetical protein
MIVYSQPGSVSFSACKKERIVVQPARVEALGVRCGLQMAKEANILEATICSDVKVAVNCINSTSFVATIDRIIQDCKTLIAEMSKVNVLFVNRSLNSAAHSQVGLSKTVGFRIWLWHVPTKSNSSCNVVISASVD